MVPHRSIVSYGPRTAWQGGTDFDSITCFYFHPLRTQKVHLSCKSRSLVGGIGHTSLCAVPRCFCSSCTSSRIHRRTTWVNWKENNPILFTLYICIQQCLHVIVYNMLKVIPRVSGNSKILQYIK